MSRRLTSKVLLDVWGAGVDDVFAVGDVGVILHYDGSTWSAMDSHTTKSLFNISGSSSHNVFAVGDNGTILRYSGKTWSSMDASCTNSLYSVLAVGADVFAVGWDAAILHYSITPCLNESILFLLLE